MKNLNVNFDNITSKLDWSDSLEEEWTRGFDPSSRKLSIKSSLARPTLEPISKVGWKFWDLLSHLLSFERSLRSKIGYAHGTHHPKS